MKFYSDICLRATDIYTTPNIHPYNLNAEFFDTNEKDSQISLKHAWPLAGGTELLSLYGHTHPVSNKHFITASGNTCTLLLDTFVDIGRYFTSDITNKTIKYFKNNSSADETIYQCKNINTGCCFVELIVKDSCGSIVPKSDSIIIREQILNIIDSDDMNTIIHFKRPIIYQKKSNDFAWDMDSPWERVYEPKLQSSNGKSYVYLPHPLCTTTSDDGPCLEAYSIKADANIEAYAYYATSDSRKKTNLAPLGQYNILNLPLYSFDYINGQSNQIGCLAQDLQKICPQLVHTDEEGFLSIQETKLIYLLIQEVKTLQDRLQALENHNTI